MPAQDESLQPRQSANDLEIPPSWLSRPLVRISSGPPLPLLDLLKHGHCASLFPRMGITIWTLRLFTFEAILPTLSMRIGAPCILGSSRPSSGGLTRPDPGKSRSCIF